MKETHLDTGARHHVCVDDHRLGGEELVEEIFVEIDGFYDEVIRAVARC